MFALCGIRSKTNLADQRHLRTNRKKNLRHSFTALPISWPSFWDFFFILIFRTMGVVAPLNFDTSYHTTRQPFIMSLRIHLDLLPTASYVPREDLTYTTLTLSNKDIVFRYGLFVVSAPTQTGLRLRHLTDRLFSNWT